mmetsp:Transcript_52575/g.97339  ORF Transcript_52575/g.97339 Transcript_52575/m.97339 type:complete len:148 (-) Transcript_52575:80-523(-)
MFAALRSKSKEFLGHHHEAVSPHHEGDGGEVRRSVSKGRKNSKGQPHTVEQLHRKIAAAEEEIKHHLKCRCKHSAVHAIKKKQMYEKELATLMKEQGITEIKSENKELVPDVEDVQLEAEYIRRLSTEPTDGTDPANAAAGGAQASS